MRHSFLTLTLLLFANLAQAASIEQPLADTQQEQMAREIIGDLRCVVCEGQSLADSDAALARQMRAQVRKRIADGESRSEVLAFFRSHYGDEILMQPPLHKQTLLLWLAPLLLLGLGAALVVRGLRPGKDSTP